MCGIFTEMNTPYDGVASLKGNATLNDMHSRSSRPRLCKADSARYLYVPRLTWHGGPVHVQEGESVEMLSSEVLRQMAFRIKVACRASVE